jgi:hypothetical protein
MHRSPKRIPGIFILYFLSFLHISTKFGSFLRFFYSNNKIRKRKTSAQYRVSFGPRPQPAGSAQRPIRPDRPAPGRGAAEGSRGFWRLHAAGGDNGEARAPASTCCWERCSRHAPQPWARARIRPPCARPRLGRAGDSLTDCKGGP